MFFAFVFFTVSMLTACAPKSQLPTIPVVYYPQCYAPFKELNTYQEQMQQRRLFYVSSGAVTGAAVGAFAGVATAGWQGAVAGGIAGSILGATAGFTLAKIEEIKEEDKRLASYRLLIGDDLANATALEMAALQSLMCYLAEFEKLRDALTSRRITRADFDKQYAEIRAGMAELGKLTGDARTLMAQRETDMRASLQREISRSNPSSESLPTVEQRRFQRERREKSAVTRPRRRSQRPPVAERMTHGGLESVRLELGSLETEVREDRARQDVRREEDLRAQAVQSRESTHNVNAAPVTHGELIAVYDDYPNKVLQLEAIEKQRVKSLQIMDETAAVMGIDNV
ncbi:MAG: hypothetical protein IJU76_05215 [Desulfovibrionaceae bacterium]|nr:hypothetical protein [Desulfovibrionaceae bacterium]